MKNLCQKPRSQRILQLGLMSNRKTSETNKTRFAAQAEGEIQMRLLKIPSMQQGKTGARRQINFS